MKIDENQYQCRYCDNTFNYVDPNTPKVTRNVTVTESNHCPICGRGVTAGTSNKCTVCGISDFCSNCVFETSENKISCKNCISTISYDCLVCHNNYSIYRCPSCVKLYEKNSIPFIYRLCSEHLGIYGNTKVTHFSGCPNCGFTCPDCQVKEGWFNSKCKFCGNKIKVMPFSDQVQFKNQNQSYVDWFNAHL
jgi:hypothetical protein